MQLVNFTGAAKRVKFVKRSGKRVALILVEAPEGVGQNLQAPPEVQDFLFIVHIPRAAADEMDSPIARPSIILPS